MDQPHISKLKSLHQNSIYEGLYVVVKKTSKLTLCSQKIISGHKIKLGAPTLPKRIIC